MNAKTDRRARPEVCKACSPRGGAFFRSVASDLHAEGEIGVQVRKYNNCGFEKPCRGRRKIAPEVRALFERYMAELAAEMECGA